MKCRIRRKSAAGAATANNADVDDAVDMTASREASPTRYSRVAAFISPDGLHGCFLLTGKRDERCAEYFTALEAATFMLYYIYSIAGFAMISST